MLEWARFINRIVTLKHWRNKIMTFTEKESKAIKTIMANNDIEICGAGPHCWSQPEDLIGNGFSKHETAGLYSALMEKGILWLYEPRTKSEGGDLYTLDIPKEFL
jgi:hypothetical protein